MASLRDDTESVEIVRVVEGDATVQEAVAKHGHTVEQGGDRQCVGRWCGLDRSTGTERVDGGRKLGGRLRSDEHDVITDRQRQFFALPQAENFRCRQVDEGGLVRDLRDRRLVEELASDRTDRFFETDWPAERALAGGDVDYRPDGSLGYDAFWLDEGTTWQPSGRTSLIVDPPNGRIPYTPTARDHERPYGTGPWDSHLDLDTGERCFGDGLPQIWFGDNPNHQIFQTPTDVVILHEMYHVRRIIIPIDGRPRTGIPRWNGEPRGRWDGNTLVVESRYFPDRSQDRFRHVWRAPSASLRVVERFTRVDAGTIDYEATITDPVRFARPWTVRFTMSSDQAGRGVAPGHLFEYACHEGNYAIVNVLRGARVQEAHAAGR